MKKNYFIDINKSKQKNLNIKKIGYRKILKY